MKFYKQFSVDERNCLQLYLRENKSLREIAKLLNRNVSTISREIKRNSQKDGTYLFNLANTLYIKRRQRCVRRLRLKKDKDLLSFIKKCLDKFWSPEIITMKWKEINENVKLSPTTIYRAIKNKILPKYTAKKHLRRRGKAYRNKRKFITIKPDNLIRDWTEDIVNRQRIGDWEGDTICGAKGKGALVTLVDRKSRYLVAYLIKTQKSSETKNAILQSLKGKIVNSISLDNGSEFAEHRKINDELGVKIYFADLRSPWQRGSNENINGLIRFFFPKGCNFHDVTQKELDKVLKLINNRPRKCLNWQSPVEFLRGCCT